MDNAKNNSIIDLLKLIMSLLVLSIHVKPAGGGLRKPSNFKDGRPNVFYPQCVLPLHKAEKCGQC